STARDAMMLDYRSIMVSDALASFTEHEHVGALQNWMLYFGDVLDTEGIIHRLDAGQSANGARSQRVTLAAGSSFRAGATITRPRGTCCHGAGNAGRPAGYLMSGGRE